MLLLSVFDSSGYFRIKTVTEKSKRYINHTCPRLVLRVLRLPGAPSPTLPTTSHRSHSAAGLRPLRAEAAKAPAGQPVPCGTGPWLPQQHRAAEGPAVPLRPPHLRRPRRPAPAATAAPPALCCPPSSRSAPSAVKRRPAPQSSALPQSRLS